MTFKSSYRFAPLSITPDRRKALFQAKKMLPEYVFDTSKLEGNPITFPEVQTLMDGITVGGHKISDVQQVLNIRDAWQTLLGAIQRGDFAPTMQFANSIHACIAREEALEWGKFRTGSVGISGTQTYTAPPADELSDIFTSELPTVLAAHSPVEAALNLFLWMALNQFYWDGNKRTARIMACGVLIDAGVGVFNIRAADILKFNIKMCAFYDSQDASEIMPFLAQKCVKYI